MGTGTSEKKNNIWDHPQFTVAVVAQYPDFAHKTIRFMCRDLPGLIDVQGKHLNISYQHDFQFTLPREYPQNLGKIQIIAETLLYHPRITGIGTKACYTVNGEVDRILIDIIYNVLLRPETVRPPNLYKDADWGLDASKMKWYIEYGPEKIYTHLKELWASNQISQHSPSKPKKKVQFLD